MKAIIPIGRIEQLIYVIRDKKVMLDKDLAKLYGVTTGNLNKAVKRNIKRFPDDFMFQLSAEEYDSLRFQIGSLKRGKHSKYLPHVFTEQGVAMLSGVLNSDRAVEVNIQIMRAFINLRKMILTNAEFKALVEKVEKHGLKIKDVQEQIHYLAQLITQMLSVKEKKTRKIGF